MIRSSKFARILEVAVFLRLFYVQVPLQSENLKFLESHYGEIAMNPSGSFLVEKCFTASNFSHKEAIVVELLAVQSELSKTRHGFHLLNNLDVDRYARRPDQWRASQTSKETTQGKIQVEFGSSSKPVGQNIEELFSPQSPTKKCKRKKTDRITEDSSTNKPDLSQECNSKRPKSAKATCEKESSSKKLVSQGPSTSTSFFKDSAVRKSPGFLSDKPSLKKQKHQRPTFGKSDGIKFVQDSTSTPFVKNTGKQKQSIAELADLAGKEKLTATEVRKLLKPEMAGNRFQTM